MLIIAQRCYFISRVYGSGFRENQTPTLRLLACIAMQKTPIQTDTHLHIGFSLFAVLPFNKTDLALDVNTEAQDSPPSLLVTNTKQDTFHQNKTSLMRNTYGGPILPLEWLSLLAQKVQTKAQIRFRFLRHRHNARHMSFHAQHMLHMCSLYNL